MKGNNLIKISFAFLLTWVCLPLYQIFNGHSFEIQQVSSDLLTGLSFVFIIFSFSKIIGLSGSQATSFFAVVCYSLVLTSSIIAELYFATTAQNLGADLFGYSMQDVLLTTTASGAIEGKALLYAGVMLSFFTILIFCFSRIAFYDTRLTTVTTLAFGLISFSVSSYHVLNANHSDNENRVLYFLTDWTKANATTDDAVAIKGYPFLHSIKYNNPWKGYMSRTDSLPNFVFVIVEGLGGDFVVNGKYAGFTPFLDSLSKESLYWKNGLSNAGRTFGAVPSVLGSLPYGEDGFMNLGEAMPLHQTLFTLLKSKGYQTNFFYGGNPNFDNLDLFLQRQNLDKFINSSNFSNAIEETSSNTHWGYEDDQLFSVGAQSIRKETRPRVDCYLTLSTHEPFECPDVNIKKIADNLVSVRGGEFVAHANIFECLLYTDHALRKMFQQYAQRSDFKRTVFIITGDHRLIPMESGNRLSRHHVPILVYSPLVTKPQVFSSLAIHSSIAPSVLGYLAEEYQLDFPERMPFISNALSTNLEFSSDLDLPLIRVKNAVNDYISGKILLSNNQLYEIDENLELKHLTDEMQAGKMKSKLEQFLHKSRFALANNKLDSVNVTFKSEFTLRKEESDFLQQEKILPMNPDEKLMKATSFANAKKYDQSRSVLKALLNQSPNYHDARLLLARTYGWQNKFDSAMHQVQETLNSSPEYTDAFVAWSDLEYWQGNLAASLKAAQAGLLKNPSDADLEQRKVRITKLLDSENSKNKLTVYQKQDVEK